MQLLALGHVEALGAALTEMLDELLDRLGTLTAVAIERLEHLHEGPLRPVVVAGSTGAHLPAPVEAETNLVQLTAIAVDVLEGGLLRMLARLDGILLGRQSVGIVAHGVEHVEALLALVTGIDIAGNIAQRMAHMQACPTRVREHVEHVKLLLGGIFGDTIGLLFHPSLLPLFLNVSEIVFHLFFV